MSNSIGHEARIRAALSAGDMHGAATVMLEAYGEEIRRFLIARLRNSADGEEAFSMFQEDLWRGVPSSPSCESASNA